MQMQISYQATAVLRLVLKVLNASESVRGTTHYARASQLVTQVLRHARDQLEEIYYAHVLQPEMRRAAAAPAAALSRGAGSGAERRA